MRFVNCLTRLESLRNLPFLQLNTVYSYILKAAFQDTDVKGIYLLTVGKPV